MRSLCEATWEEENKDGDMITRKGKFWLLHFGLKHEIINTGDNGLAVGNWTVAICEDCETGQLRCFVPEQIKIIGQEIKK
jgi:hypothetical protein